MSATIDEFLLAAEYILDRGNPHVMLCERGIRTYEEHTRFTLPLATVPYLHDKSHLPVVRRSVAARRSETRRGPRLCKASVAAGADALIIEVHDDLEHAVSGGFADDHSGGLRAGHATSASSSPRPSISSCNDERAGPPRSRSAALRFGSARA